MLAGLLAYVGVAYGVETALSLDTPISLGPVTALLLAGIPALLWLGYFYTQDRLEPEPKAYVLGSFVAGAFVAAPAASFLVGLATPAESSLGFSALAAERWIAAILIVGIAQEACKYVVVRYSLYLSPEFDEPIDGVIYMSAAGIGFATFESYHYLQGIGGQIYLSSGAAQCVVTTLAHASFAGIMGFAMGRAKFAGGPGIGRQMILIAGLLAAMLLNGTFQVIMDALSVQGLAASPWRRVFFSFGFAAGVFLLTSILMRRLLLISPHRPELKS